MKFLDKLDYLLSENNMSRPELAQRSGIPYSTIMSFYDEKKGTENIRLSTLRKLAIALDVSLDYLADDNVENRFLSLQGGVARIPVLGRIPAGIPFDAIEDIIDYEEIPASWTTGGREYFGLKIDGESMEPTYHSGDVVLFLKVNGCDSGQDCAVMVNGDDATFKRVKKQDDGIVLVPINPNYDARFISNDDCARLPVSILGVAKEIRRTVK